MPGVCQNLPKSTKAKPLLLMQPCTYNLIFMGAYSTNLENVQCLFFVSVPVWFLHWPFQITSSMVICDIPGIMLLTTIVMKDPTFNVYKGYIGDTMLVVTCMGRHMYADIEQILWNEDNTPSSKIGYTPSKPIPSILLSWNEGPSQELVHCTPSVNKWPDPHKYFKYVYLSMF